MPLPRANAPRFPEFLAFLQTYMPKAHQRVRSVAPHLLHQAMHGLAQDLPTVDVTASPDYSPVVDTSSAIQPVSMTDVASIGSSVPTDTTAADPTLPGGGAGGWADTIAKVVAPAIQGAEQIKLFNTQLSLAQSGRPLLSGSQIRTIQTPMGLQVGIAPQTGLLAAGIAAVIGAALLFGRRRG